MEKNDELVGKVAMLVDKTTKKKNSQNLYTVYEQRFQLPVEGNAFVFVQQHARRGGGGGGELKISSDREDLMRAKTRTQ